MFDHIEAGILDKSGLNDLNQTKSLVQSAPDRYDGWARILHWSFAVGIIYASIVGYSLDLISNQAVHDFLSHLNMSLATLLIILFPLRVVWKFMRVNPRPPAIREKELKIAKSVHNLLYLTIFVVLASGFLMVPHGYVFFGLVEIPTLFEKGRVTAIFSQMHLVSNLFLSGLVMMHIAGVISHTLFKRVDILRRML